MPSSALFVADNVHAEVRHVDMLRPWVFTVLMFGAMMPYACAAWAMNSVGKANDMVKVCPSQSPCTGACAKPPS